MAEVKAKPCPFCGSELVGTEVDLEVDPTWGWVVCSECEARGPAVREKFDASENAVWRRKTIAAWNDRANVDGNDRED